MAFRSLPHTLKLYNGQNRYGSKNKITFLFKHKRKLACLIKADGKGN